MIDVRPTTTTGTSVTNTKHNPDMDKPPKLWRLLVMLAAVVVAIVWLNHLATTLPGAK